MPLNPFARNAAAERNKRQAERANVRKREDLATAQTPAKVSPKNSSNSLAEMQKKAAKSLENDKIVTAESEQTSSPLPKPTITVTKKADTEGKVKVDIRKELNRKTAEANKKYQEIASNVTEETIQPEVEIITPESVESIAEEELAPESPQSEVVNTISSGAKNVFKTVEQTKKPSVTGDKRRRRRRMDKKGGGRQKMEKKLNRQKILAFKYFARDLLDDPNIPEEHRSNVLGQIIAKGERTSIESAIEFIQLKRAELILTDEVANSLISEIKSMTTRR